MQTIAEIIEQQRQALRRRIGEILEKINDLQMEIRFDGQPQDDDSSQLKADYPDLIPLFEVMEKLKELDAILETTFDAGVFALFGNDVTPEEYRGRLGWESNHE